MWDKIKNRKLRFNPRNSRYTRTFRGVFVKADMRYSDTAVVTFTGAYEGDRTGNHQFYIQLESPANRTKGLMPGLKLVEIRGRKGVAPDLIESKPYLSSDNDWTSIVDDSTGEVLIGPRK